MRMFVSKLVTAKRDYCVPATLQMVLEHYGIGGFTQDNIADQMSIVSSDGSTEHSKWGTQIERNTLNDFFVRNHINLRERYIPINHFSDGCFLGEELSRLLKENATIVCGFNYSWLYGRRDDTFRHVSIVVDFDAERETATLLDPGPKDAGYKDVDIDRLYIAIKMANDGLWCITEADS